MVEEFETRSDKPEPIPEPSQELKDIEKEKELIKAQIELDELKGLRDKPVTLKTRESAQYATQQAQLSKQFELDTKEASLNEREHNIETIVNERLTIANGEADSKLEEVRDQCTKMLKDCTDTIEFRLKNASSTIAKANELSQQEDRAKELDKREVVVCVNCGAIYENDEWVDTADLHCPECQSDWMRYITTAHTWMDSCRLKFQSETTE